MDFFYVIDKENCGVCKRNFISESFVLMVIERGRFAGKVSKCSTILSYITIVSYDSELFPLNRTAGVIYSIPGSLLHKRFSNKHRLVCRS